MRDESTRHNRFHIDKVLGMIVDKEGFAFAHWTLWQV